MKLITIEGNKIWYGANGIKTSDSLEAFISRGMDKKLSNSDRVVLAEYIRNTKPATIQASKIPFGGWSFSCLEERKYLPFLFMCMILFLILSIPMAQDGTRIFGFSESLGVLIFPLTYLILDSISELYGINEARKAIYSAAVLLLLSAGLVELSLNVFNVATGAFYAVFHHLPWSLLCNTICLVLSDLFTVFLFQVLRSACSNRYLWFRSILSNAVGQLAYTFIWFALFTGNLSTSGIENIFDNYLFKIIYLICLLPLLYLIVNSIRALTRNKWIISHSIKSDA